MEKRLPLAMFLCFLLLMGWQVMNPSPTDEQGAATVEGVEGESLAEGDGEDLNGDGEEPSAPLVSAEEEVVEVVEFGTPGAPGHYLAEFTNKGGCLLSLRLGDVFIKGGLDTLYKELEDALEESSDVEDGEIVELEGRIRAIETEIAWMESPENFVELLKPDGGGEDWEVASLSLTASTTKTAKELGLVGLEKRAWQMEVLPEVGEPKEAVLFTYSSDSGVVITKEFRPRAGERVIDFTLGLKSVAEGIAPGKRQFSLTPAGAMASTESMMYEEPKAVSGWRDEDGDLKVVSEAMIEAPARDERDGVFKMAGELAFVGVENKFFACLLRANEQSQGTLVGARWRRVERLDWASHNPGSAEESWRYVVADVDLALDLGEVDQEHTWVYEIYAGPKARGDLSSASSDYEALSRDDLSFFGSIATIILAILDFYQGLVGNWGWAIIMLTLTVRLALFPINRRSQTAMARYQKKMKRVQPRLDELKTKYADNTQKQREEQARIMQEEGAFPPLGGCLPMFLQIPVFIGLFQSLKVEYYLRQEPFLLWVRDLSVPDQAFRIDLSLPILGTIEWLNVLPFLMIALQIWQQRSMPKPTDEQQAKMQKMMMFMPIMFGVILYGYPAALQLYMITSSAVGIFEIRVIKKFWPIDDAETAPKKGWMMRLAEKQAEQQTAMKKMQQQQHQSRQKARKKRKR